ncbi:Ras like enriched [Capsaspora owczarzaki ATCC 30864]|uniref:Ras like enriched n=2 Tax=Capsaspora owczarzaki (strain ATCC 30864) TaxID=595528 RepID=A0A0D2WW85_CAPO3|nr:Ras like enriched [Capsaspora owczarzaki ATCC 30864]
MQFIEGQFSETYNPTIENTYQKPLSLRGGRDFLVEIVDTPGQDEFSIFPTRYSVGIHGYVLVYSVTSRTSFEMLKIIREKLLNMTGTNSVPLVLVGNKTDLVGERVVTFEDGRELAAQWGCGFVESSAKRNNSVKEIFESLLEEVDKDSLPPQKDKSGGCVIA